MFLSLFFEGMNDSAAKGPTARGAPGHPAWAAGLYQPGFGAAFPRVAERSGGGVRFCRVGRSGPATIGCVGGGRIASQNAPCTRLTQRPGRCNQACVVAGLFGFFGVASESIQLRDHRLRRRGARGQAQGTLISRRVSLWVGGSRVSVCQSANSRCLVREPSVADLQGQPIRA